MQIEHALLFASSLAAMALAGDVGVGNADALFGAVLNHVSLAQGLDVMRNERVLPDNASFVGPYILANEYSIQAHAMSLYSVLESSGTLHAEPTRTSTVAYSVKGTLVTKVELPFPTPSKKTCSLKNKDGKHCEVLTCTRGTGTCSMGRNGCTSSGLTGDSASVACLSCQCTEDA